MAITLILLLQAVAGPPVPRDLRPAIVNLPRPCPTAASGGEIVVCGRAPDGQRLEKLPDRSQSRSVQDPLTFRLPDGGTGDVHAVQNNLPGGTGSGLVTTLRIPFGKKTRDAPGP